MKAAVELPDGSEVEWDRGDGNLSCPTCGEPTGRHPVDEDVQRATGRPGDRTSGLILHVLCNGDRVKT